MGCITASYTKISPHSLTVPQVITAFGRFSIVSKECNIAVRVPITISEDDIFPSRHVALEWLRP